MLYNVEKLLLYTKRYGLINSECMLSFSYFLEKRKSFEYVKYIQMVHHNICLLVTKKGIITEYDGRTPGVFISC